MRQPAPSSQADSVSRVEAPPRSIRLNPLTGAQREVAPGARAAPTKTQATPASRWAARRKGRVESQRSQDQCRPHKLLVGSTHMQDPASQTAFMEMGPGGRARVEGLVCWRVAVTCWLVPAAAASCRHVTRCSRRPCSGPCTWRCTSGEGTGEPLRSGPQLVPPPRQRTAHAQYPLHASSLSQRTRGDHPTGSSPRPRDPATPVLPAPNCPGNPPASRYTSGSTCPSSSVGTREPSVATPAPADPAALSPPPRPRPAPDL